jgi:hypothetical protein
MPRPVAQELELTLRAHEARHPDALADVYRQLRSIATDFDTTVTAAARDAKLSPAGRDAAIESAARDAGRKLADIEAGPLARVRDNVTALRRDLLAPAVPVTHAATAGLTRLDLDAAFDRVERRRAIVAAAAQLSAAERDALFIGSVSDTDVFEALANAAPVIEKQGAGLPQLRPFISSAVRDRALLARGRAARPTVAAQLDTAGAVEAALTAAVRTAQEAIGRAGTAAGGATGKGRASLQALTSREGA